MITVQMHSVSEVKARFDCVGPSNNWVVLSFPGRDEVTEITLFFDENKEAAEAYAEAINGVHVEDKVDEREAA